MRKNNTVTKNWFKDWSNEYDNTLGKVKRHHKLLDLVVESSGLKDGDAVLDIGCGTGLLSLKFLNKADCVIYGIDSSREMLELFKSKIDKYDLSGKISLEPGDAEDLDFENEKFDIIASTVTLHHVKNKYPVIKKIYKLLKPGGKFILGDIDVDTTGNLEDPKRLLRIIDFLKEEFVLALKEGGVKAFSRMYDNGKKHILNDGEFCVSFKQWKEICKNAGFKKITIKPLPKFKWFKVLIAVK
ncbi:methyltransferase domain-containing protein [candidate division WOR-3 bacterium]|nr:methyltransferase domain-containing protein [candidate division WOR-3 bacterium]